MIQVPIIIFLILHMDTLQYVSWGRKIVPVSIYCVQEYGSTKYGIIDTTEAYSLAHRCPLPAGRPVDRSGYLRGCQ